MNEVEGLIKVESFRIDPQSIFINRDTNIREYYGDEEAWEIFKDSIRTKGLETAIKIKHEPEYNRYRLIHGFRRMTAVKQIIEEDGYGTHEHLNHVPAELVDYDDIEEIKSHFLLNSGLDMTDVEKAKGIQKLSRMTGEENVAELARMCGLTYQKTLMLHDFINRSGTQVINAIHSNKISFSNAYNNIIKKAGSVTEQNHLLKEAIKEAERNGDKRVVLNKVKNRKPIDTSSVRLDKSNFQVKLGNLLIEATLSDDSDPLVIERFKKIIKGLDDGKSNEELLQYLSPNFSLNEEKG